MARTAEWIPLSFPVHGITGPGSILPLKSVLEQPGVCEGMVDPETGLVSLRYNPAQTDALELVEALSGAGYRVPTQEIVLNVTGMHCISCAAHVEGAVNDVPGVLSAAVDLRAGKTTVQYLSDAALEQIKRAIEELGYGLAE